MDKKKQEIGSWGWLPVAMPKVARLIADKRREVGDAHVRECWKRGVVEQQPGWFFAREGALAVGTPWPDIADVAGWQVTQTQAMVILRDAPAAVVAAGAAHGA
jgi:hypothetical protein